MQVPAASFPLAAALAPLAAALAVSAAFVRGSAVRLGRSTLPPRPRGPLRAVVAWLPSGEHGRLPPAPTCSVARVAPGQKGYRPAETCTRRRCRYGAALAHPSEAAPAASVTADAGTPLQLCELLQRQLRHRRTPAGRYPLQCPSSRSSWHHGCISQLLHGSSSCGGIPAAISNVKTG